MILFFAEKYNSTEYGLLWAIKKNSCRVVGRAMSCCCHDHIVLVNINNNFVMVTNCKTVNYKETGEWYIKELVTLRIFSVDITHSGELVGAFLNCIPDTP